MGYEVEPDLIRITDEAMPGLEVLARSTSIATVRRLQARAAGFDTSNVTAETAGKMLDVGEDLLAVFVEHVDEWNLTVRGEPVPVTVEGLMSVPNQRLPWALYRGWLAALSEVDRPLPEGSPSGEPAPGVSVPMVPLSPSLAS